MTTDGQLRSSAGATPIVSDGSTLPGGSARSDPSLARSLRSALERLQTTELLDWQVRVETDAGRNAVPANVRFAAGSRRRSWHIPDLRRTAAIWPNADLQAARVHADFVKGFGCRPLRDGSDTAVGRRSKVSRGGNRGTRGRRRRCRDLWGFSRPLARVVRA
jgi:hypothetical protein